MMQYIIIITKNKYNQKNNNIRKREKWIKRKYQLE